MSITNNYYRGNIVERIYECKELGMRLAGISTDDPKTTLFDAMDVARQLGWNNTSKAVHDLVWSEYKTSIRGIKASNGQPKVFLKVSGVIQLIMKSKLPAAHEFQKWVYEAVLPEVLFGNSTNDSVNYKIRCKELQNQFNLLCDQVGKFGEALCKLGEDNLLMNAPGFVFN